MSVDVLKNLHIKANVQLLTTCVRYLEHDQRKRRLPDRPATYLADLGKRIVLLNEDLPWVPLKANYFFLNDDHDKKFNLIPHLVNGNWPANPELSDLGFGTRPI